MVDSINMAAAAEEVDVEITVIEEFRAFDFSAGSLPLDLAEKALRHLGLEPKRCSTGGGSDVNVFNQLGLPCVNLSTGMQKVHTPDESISVGELNKAHQLIMALVEQARMK